MSDFSLRDPEVWGAIAAVGLCIGGVVTYMAMRKRPTDEELELLRRQELVQSGRIIDGTVIDISDLDPHESGRPNGLQLILYKYAIAGVWLRVLAGCDESARVCEHLRLPSGVSLLGSLRSAPPHQQHCGSGELERPARYGELRSLYAAFHASLACRLDPSGIESARLRPIH